MSVTKIILSNLNYYAQKLNIEPIELRRQIIAHDTTVNIMVILVMVGIVIAVFIYLLHDSYSITGTELWNKKDSTVYKNNKRRRIFMYVLYITLVFIIILSLVLYALLSSVIAPDYSVLLNMLNN
nr:MAG TPA: hypothetical protein [Caudoviricetes sp.]